MKIDWSNQVWHADIIDISLAAELVSLVAVMDRFSRSVLAGALSITPDVLCCLDALEQALGPMAAGALRHRNGSDEKNWI